jgi:hypothetical protein
LQNTNSDFNIVNFVDDIVDEVLDNFDSDNDTYVYDLVSEIVDSNIPVYNGAVIEMASSLHGEDFTEVWLTDGEHTTMADCENVVRFLQIKLYDLLHRKVCDSPKIERLLVNN